MAVLVTAVGVYWSLRGDPVTPWPNLVPLWVFEWSERHGTTRNYPAYLILALFWFIAGRNWKQRMALGIALAGFAALAEVVQIWLPHRVASSLDVLCSWAGIATAWALCRLGRRALWRWRERRAERLQRDDRMFTGGNEGKGEGG
jgi:hypothetical protein